MFRNIKRLKWVEVFQGESRSNLADLSCHALDNTLNLWTFAVHKSGVCFLASIAYGNPREPKSMSASCFDLGWGWGFYPILLYWCDDYIIEERMVDSFFCHQWKWNLNLWVCGLWPAFVLWYRCDSTWGLWSGDGFISDKYTLAEVCETACGEKESSAAQLQNLLYVPGKWLA